MYKPIYSIEELMQEIVKDAKIRNMVNRRYPVRFIFSNNRAQFRELLIVYKYN